MNITGMTSFPLISTNSSNSVSAKGVEDATKARRAFEVTQREAEKTPSANSAGPKGNGTSTANTLYHAQNIAQQFKDFMDKSPDQMLREQILRELGLTEEDLKNMEPKELAKVQDKIKQLMEEKIEQSMREKGVEIEIGGKAAISSVTSSV